MDFYYRFIADCHLGKLAKYMRIMGFDPLFFPHIEDDELINLANKEKRIILTRDRELSIRKNAPVFYLEPTDTKKQLKTLIEHFHLREHPIPFSRCIVCNSPLQIVQKEKTGYFRLFIQCFYLFFNYLCNRFFINPYIFGTKITWYIQPRC